MLRQSNGTRSLCRKKDAFGNIIERSEAVIMEDGFIMEDGLLIEDTFTITFYIYGFVPRSSVSENTETKLFPMTFKHLQVKPLLLIVVFLCFAVCVMTHDFLKAFVLLFTFSELMPYRQSHFLQSHLATFHIRK